jgi:methyl-accepting chemotaxis protein
LVVVGIQATRERRAAGIDTVEQGIGAVEQGVDALASIASPVEDTDAGVTEVSRATAEND